MMFSQSHPIFLKKLSCKINLLLLLLFLNLFTLNAQQIHKFEQINSYDGLSQNFVQSIHCDHKGFLWFGTWDGLNRYDGKDFKIFKVNPNQRNSLTNNRIIDIWEDKQNTLWVKTNDGYSHYFVEETYEFITYPYYLKSLEERNSTITCFEEGNNQEVLLGSSNSGLYYLQYDSARDRYFEHQYLNRGESTISHNYITFIHIDQENEIWIGTKKGLNNISRKELNKENPSFSNYWLDNEFTTVHQLNSLIIFGTKEAGIKTFEQKLRRFDTNPELFEDLADKSITIIHSQITGKLLIGAENDGLYVYDLVKGYVENRFLTDHTIKKIYQDTFGQLWINTEEFGIYKLDNSLKKIKYFELTNKSIKNLVDDERQFIYEDSQRNLWIALHGAGLAYFNRDLSVFEFYRNQPNDNTSISSDNIYCIAEDQSGMLWIGAGIPNGGVNKVLTANQAFNQILLENDIISGNENVVRSLLIDMNNRTWVGTKSGALYILDESFNIQAKFEDIPTIKGLSPGQNAYTMMQDNEDFVWIGTKGGGIFVTQTPITKSGTNYDNLVFNHYTNDANDDTSISSDIIYSIFQDSNNRIWIGSYDGGINLVTSRENNTLNIKRYNTSNSGISSDKVRNIFEDNQHRLWIATAFGLNYIDLDQSDISDLSIKSTLFDPRRPNSLSYNDVIHTYQDSENRIWFGTSGGGVNKLIASDGDTLQFSHINTNAGLINDVVYAILEDHKGCIWFSTDHGITCYNPEEGSFENFDENNNLTTDVFNENTCAINQNGELLFGTNEGLLVIYPDKIIKNSFKPNVVFTNFQLFNKDVDISSPNSPIKQDIETLDEIKLKHFQSSFSIEYAALSYFAPTKNKYAFMLENFDENWNEVGNQNKATYTNLSPGDYVFKVRAANWNSDWSDKIRSIRITIQPPWWKTTEMYITYFIILIIIIEVIRRSYLRYHKLQNDLQVEKRVNDIKLQFFTNISHEIRTPLTLILGPVHDMVEIKNIPKNISDKLHLIEKNGKRMLRLVNQLLDFRKIQKNKMTLRVHKTELISFIESIIENFKLVADQKGVKILFETDIEELDIWVDPNKFDSVIFNILSNALKFSPRKGRINICIETKEPQFVKINIQDQGKGIPKGRLNMIFERFSPLSEDNEEFGSSGIGLAYSYQIVKLHQGELEVKSELNKGSIFSIKILKGSSHFTEEEIQKEEAESLYLIKHEKIIEEEVNTPTNDLDIKESQAQILIVEDNNEILNYLKEYLQSDFNIITSENGKEALLTLETNNPDIIITDLMMPVMDGLEFTNQIKENIDTSHIPVIMLTAKSAIEDQIHGIESGAEAYILKPFNLSYVRAVINNLLKQRQIIHDKYIRNKDNGYSDLKITNKDTQFLDDINKLIMDNYSDPEFNIEKLVENSYVSRTVFYHKIKSLTGLTPIDFLRQKRLHIASQMILETDYNVSEIAAITGFNDVKNFSKRFKEIYKLTPTQYKQEMINEN